MLNSLIDKMSNDMGITRYKNEIDKDFYTRIIYSSMSEWMRYFILDKTNEDDKEIKSKIYIRNRGKEVLDNYLKLFPECEPYFYMDFNENNGEHPINIIREQMLINGDLIQLESGISLPKIHYQQISERLFKILGLTNDNKRTFGLSRVCFKNDNLNFTSSEVLDSEKYISRIVKSIGWEKISEINDFEIFNPYLKQPPYKCWQKNMKIENGFLSLARLKVFDYDYYFLKKEKDTCFISKMSDPLKEYAEYRRFISLLRHKNSNSLVANTIKTKHYVELNLYARLPKLEENFLMCFSWPKRHINDRFYYIIPIEVWELVKCKLNDLKIQVQEN